MRACEIVAMNIVAMYSNSYGAADRDPHRRVSAVAAHHTPARSRRSGPRPARADARPVHPARVALRLVARRRTAQSARTVGLDRPRADFRVQARPSTRTRRTSGTSRAPN